MCECNIHHNQKFANLIGEFIHKIEKDCDGQGLIWYADILESIEEVFNITLDFNKAKHSMKSRYSGEEFELFL